MTRKIGIIITIVLFLHISLSGLPVSAAVYGNLTKQDSTKISSGVTHSFESYQSGSLKEAIHLLEVDLNDTYTKLELGVSNPINRLKQTSTLANEYNYEGHRVVGATNAAFFLPTGYPANLLAQNNEIINYGILGENYDSPTQKPVAFGISKSGKAIADYYETDLSFTVNGKEYPIDRINYERGSGKTVLYTADWSSTKTNQWGVEIVVENSSQDTKTLHFGDTFTGTIQSVSTYGTGGNATIPSDGFVISVQNKELATQLASTLKKGMEVGVNVSIDDKWMDADFILAAGPLLVKDGKVNISMSSSSSFVKTRSDRTAVAIDATGKKVFLVTVDGRQSGYSNGTSLTDLASYLISKGASAAINLDGGGSTTMVARQLGDSGPTLVNRPSGGSERYVSAILQAVNTAPQGKLQSFTVQGVPEEMLVGASYSLKVTKAYDEYFNPVSLNPADVKWSVEGGIGTIEGAEFTATKAGKGKIVGVYDDAKVELNVNVTEIAEDTILLDSFDNVNLWTAKQARANASISNLASWEPIREGSSALKLSYDFTTKETGTKAAYVVAKTPIAIQGRPDHIGVWVYGDQGNHWLRGILVDANGENHTIDFTTEGGFNWSGWKYVTASIPEDITLPIQFQRIYVVEPIASLQNKGTVYFDKLQAVYAKDYQEPVYKDVTEKHWAFDSILSLYDRQLIQGYPDGSFKPDASITRAEAAVILARELDLKKTKNPNFSDVKSSHFAYNEIAAVVEQGIFDGREANIFAPDETLTRAEMAKILTRAFNYGTDVITSESLPFKDVAATYWAYPYIHTLYVHKLTNGYPDQTFKPAQNITRAEFAAMLDNVLSQ